MVLVHRITLKIYFDHIRTSLCAKDDLVSLVETVNKHRYNIYSQKRHSRSMMINIALVCPDIN